MLDAYKNEYARIKRADRTCVVQVNDPSPFASDEYYVKFTVESGTVESGLYRYHLRGCMRLDDAMSILAMLPPANEENHHVQGYLKTQEVWFENDQAARLGREFDTRWFISVEACPKDSPFVQSDMYWLDRLHPRKPIPYDPKENERADPRRRVLINFDGRHTGIRWPRPVRKEPLDATDVEEETPSSFAFR